MPSRELSTDTEPEPQTPRIDRDTGALTWPDDDAAGEPRRSVFLPAYANAIRAARLFTAEALADWRLSAAADEVELCVFELVSNAYRHGTDGAAHDRPRIRLTLRPDRARLYVEVHDSGSGAPIMRPLPEFRASSEKGGIDIREIPETGNGLRIVQALSDGWTWRLLPVGKVVSCWFTLGCPSEIPTMT